MFCSMSAVMTSLARLAVSPRENKQFMQARKRKPRNTEIQMTNRRSKLGVEAATRVHTLSLMASTKHTSIIKYNHEEYPKSKIK